MANGTNKNLGKVNPLQDDIFDEQTQTTVTGPRREELVQEFQDTGTLPKGTFFTEKGPTMDERAEVLKEFQAQEKAKQEIATQEAPQLPMKPTIDNPVVERGEVDQAVIQPIEINRDTITDIRAKQLAGEEISQEEKKALANVTARLQIGQSLTDIFGETPDSGVTEQQQIQAESDRQTLEEQAKQRENQRIARTAERISIADEEARRQREAIEKQTQRVQNQTQRLRSLRGVGRSTATEEEILDLERQGQALISAVDEKARLEREAIRMQEEGAASEDIARIREALAEVDNNLQQQVTKSLEAQKEIDMQLGADFAESLENMLGTLETAGVEIGDFDKNATEALGYISDSKGNPLKLDENGDPIAPLGPIGENVKISNFKDANDNTYVYKNGVLDSIITNTGAILKGEQLQSQQVPAIVTASKDEKARRDFETQLRKEFNSRQEIKEFNTVRSSYLRMLKAKEASSKQTGAGDIALVFSYMKMLDPTSVVREGEFATAANSGGVASGITNLYNKVLTGQFLNDTQRKEFVDLGKEILNSESQNVQNIANQFENIADEAGLRKDFIIGDIESGVPTTSTDSQLGTFKTSSGFEIDFDSIDNITPQQTDTFEADVDEFDNL